MKRVLPLLAGAALLMISGAHALAGPGGRVAPEQQSCGDRCVTKQSLGTRKISAGASRSQGATAQTQPQQASLLTRIGNTNLHLIYGGAMIYRDVVSGFSLVQVTFSTTGTITASAFVFKNNGSVPAPAPVAIKVPGS